jgi:hypothetical protein
MKTILIKSGEYYSSNSYFISSLDVAVFGENGTLIIPKPGVIAFQGVGDDNIFCSKCNYILASKININQIQTLSIKCPSCGFITKV